MRGIFFIIVAVHGVSSSPRYSHLSLGQNHYYGLHSLIVPLPCQADVLYEQLNYICVNNEIKCLPGWKVGPGEKHFFLKMTSILLMFSFTPESEQLLQRPSVPGGMRRGARNLH